MLYLYSDQHDSQLFTHAYIPHTITESYFFPYIASLEDNIIITTTTSTPQTPMTSTTSTTPTISVAEQTTTASSTDSPITTMFVGEDERGDENSRNRSGESGRSNRDRSSRSSSSQSRESSQSNSDRSSQSNRDRSGESSRSNSDDSSWPRHAATIHSTFLSDTCTV